MDSLEDRFDKSAITYIPNTAETAYYGLLEGLRVYRRKRVHAQLLEALRNGTLDENMLDSAILKRWPRGEKNRPQGYQNAHVHHAGKKPCAAGFPRI